MQNFKLKLQGEPYLFYIPRELSVEWDIFLEKIFNYNVFLLFLWKESQFEKYKREMMHDPLSCTRSLLIFGKKLFYCETQRKTTAKSPSFFF